ncbi:glucose-6-phosphate isomerase [Syntrophobotulus glycolicus]|nr:glucose-6-phosphate isomerase [Syntrophobotulus glycolicus]
MDKLKHWDRFRQYLCYHEDISLSLDISRMRFEDDFFRQAEPQIEKAFAMMRELENGAIANPDENRMVGHYWLRNPDLAPNGQIREEINAAIRSIHEFARKIHSGQIKGQFGREFKNILVIGVGGSGLGPRFVGDALRTSGDKIRAYYLDNTDPDGIDRVMELLDKDLDRTLTVVISKSGSTIETRNGMEEVKGMYRQAGLEFARHAVSITQTGSKLDETHKEEGWLGTFPMWDWVGGRTSVLSPVGLLPLALQGVDISLLLEGAQRCDALTRNEDLRSNPAAQMALMWLYATKGQGGRQMVVLPYKDRLILLSKYLQQLIMESLGKELDLDGNIVRQGIAVYGNKGSTDQHSFIQQLLEGPDNFFITFIEVLKDRETGSPFIADNSTSGEFLHSFLLGTRNAISKKERESITITISEVNEITLGAVLALFERTVGLYAFLIRINAYHQPGVELGKKSAGEMISLKNRIVDDLRKCSGCKYTVEALAEKMGEEDIEAMFSILRHLVHNPEHGIKVEKNDSPNMNIFQYVYYYRG